MGMELHIIPFIFDVRWLSGASATRCACRHEVTGVRMCILQCAIAHAASTQTGLLGALQVSLWDHHVLHPCS
jgi:hypothetical protein